mmetsp:Transcript_13957/g.21206  ORF Transcript_13957/g.21206 Transcript_13957/m.21206 type:complete len:233 (+) Transcript_13957:241-939(+)|eukprot:CAMPEP_0194577662 /NCGR_PEP_ID=MMETSP0292-20121207/12365_1 /TAXON_ID=39354 /ORGANISM="Heterosigma akashiwo, Strain CCMP2393" /LENGTH=232 /DNA_ID=CAMNT_0039430111 /DNA_START=211 /DNA_END=909 /DNA_ORIENTATION=+
MCRAPLKNVAAVKLSLAPADTQLRKSAPIKKTTKSRRKRQSQVRMNSSSPLEMATASDGTVYSRPDLIAWFKQSCQHLGSSTEVFYLALNIFDRYTGTARLSQTDVNLALIVCIGIASKFIDGASPSFKIFEAYGYAHDDLVETEKRVLQAVRFELMVPTIFTNLLDLCKFLGVGENTANLATQILEHELLYHEHSHLNTVSVAKKVLKLACSVLGLQESGLWPQGNHVIAH